MNFVKNEWPDKISGDKTDRNAKFDETSRWKTHKWLLTIDDWLAILIH